MKRFAQYDIDAWVRQAPDGRQRELRAAVHTILVAIANDADLNAKMIVKGGILMAVRYHSSRFTKDIDFSTSLKLPDVNPDDIRQRLDAALRLAVEALDYEIDCRVQACKMQPANQPEASFPNIALRIGYAAKGTPKHRRLLDLQSPSVISIDYSLNEIVSSTEPVIVGAGKTVEAYGFVDLAAEKFRSLLQQVPRNRYRRQDVYDLFMLSQLEVTEVEKREILRSLMKKARSRGIEPHPTSLADEEVKRRAGADYDTLKDEIEGELPAFEEAFATVLAFYGSLPWPTDGGCQ